MLMVKLLSVVVFARVNAMSLASEVVIVLPLSYAACRVAPLPAPAQEAHAILPAVDVRQFPLLPRANLVLLVPLW